ncbi:MAG TPA: response regulator [Bryobacteraceae bacterium]|nr:response regulator [Bryobacteraceae bacterium]
MAEEQRATLVALIEDNPADVYLVREALRAKNLNCELTVFQSFEDALTAIESGAIIAPDAFIIDLNLRTGSGLDILEAIRGSEPLRKASIAILTSSDSPRDREAAIRLGANLYVRKPNELDGFLDEVGQAITTLTGGKERLATAG